MKPLREVETGQTTWTLAALVDHWREGFTFAEQYGRIDKEIGAVIDVESDEELVELIQRSWERYGVSLVVGVVLALGGVLGWRSYEGPMRSRPPRRRPRLSIAISRPGQKAGTPMRRWRLRA